MAKKVMGWQANDGIMFNTEHKAMEHDALLEDLYHECPNCKCAGKIDGKPITEEVLDEEAMGYQGNFPRSVYKTVVTGHEKVKCEYCDGMGWTAEPLKPIIEGKVVGWEK